MSRRSLQGTLVPIASGLAAVIAVSGVSPALAAGSPAAADPVRAQEWWLDGLHVTQAWRTSDGAGVTVAVLGTGVAASHPDLAGAVTTGPDFTGSGRMPGDYFWGVNGTAVAGLIAGHGHGRDGRDGVVGVAPAARILSVRVDLEYNDPLNSDPAVTQQLPAAIADGIRYAVSHGAQVIDLPLDPGTLGLAGQDDPAAAGGSPAERAAVAGALRKGVLLVAPAGDDGQGAGLVNYPAAYPGVIAVGAVDRDGQVASFSSRHGYVSLTAPGVHLMVATPPDGYTQLSSTSMASGIVTGVAALILSRFPHLTVAQVTRALTGSGTVSAPSADGADTAGTAGTGHGTVDAARAVALAAAIAAAATPRPTASPSPRTSPSPHRSVRPPAAQPAAQPHQASASTLAGSAVRDVVAGLCVLILLVAALLLVIRARRARSAARAARVHVRGQHGHRRPQHGPGPDQAAAPGASPLVSAEPPVSPVSAVPPVLAVPVSPARGNWTAAGGWQGSMGELAPSSASSRPVIRPAPKPARATPGAAGPPWEPAPEPERMFGPLPTGPATSLPPDPGPGIRVPGDMAAILAAPPGATPAVPFDFTMPPDPDFPPRPGVTDGAVPGPPAQHSLDLAAAPVPVDYAPPRAPDFTVPSRAAGLVLSADADPAASSAAGAEPSAARPSAPGTLDEQGTTDPSYIWDLAATDVFPAAPGAFPAPDAADTVPDAADTAPEPADPAVDAADTAPGPADPAADTAPGPADTAADAADTAPGPADPAADAADTAPEPVGTAADTAPEAVGTAADAADTVPAPEVSGQPKAPGPVPKDDDPGASGG